MDESIFTNLRAEMWNQMPAVREPQYVVTDWDKFNRDESMKVKQEEWFSGIPARMIAALGGVTEANRERLERWKAECVKLCDCDGERGRQTLTMDSFEQFTNYSRDYPRYTCRALELRPQLLHCLFGNPFSGERVQCPECEGVPDARAIKGDTRYGCRKCKGLRTIPAPLIEPEWRSGTVVDLAKVVSGWKLLGDPDTGFAKWVQRPDYSRLPILCDALEEAGCPVGGFVLGHLGQGVHCKGCLILKEIC